MVLDISGGWTSSKGTHYTQSQIVDLINFRSGFRRTSFRLDLLDSSLNYKHDITPFVTKVTLDRDADRAVQRQLTLEMVETVADETVDINGGPVLGANISYFSDRVKPYVRIGAPDGGWLDFPQGVYMFTQPGVRVPGYGVVRFAEMPDQCQVVAQKVATSTSGAGIPLILPPSVFITDAITSLLDNAQTNIQTDPPALNTLPGCALSTLLGATLPTSSQVDARIAGAGYTVSDGTTYLDLINHLLYYLSYYPLYCDDAGKFQFQAWPPNQDYTTQASVWTYDTTDPTASIVYYGTEETFDLLKSYNAVFVKVEDPARQPFYATARVDAATAGRTPSSPIDVSVLGRVITDIVEDPNVPNAASQDWAQNFAIQRLIENSRLVDTVTLPTAINPLFGDGKMDVVNLNLYQKYVAAGSPQNVPVITGITIPGYGAFPGLVISEKFLLKGYTISGTLRTPGPPQMGNSGGLTASLDVRDQPQGCYMTSTLQRITSICNRADMVLV